MICLTVDILGLPFDGGLTTFLGAHEDSSGTELLLVHLVTCFLNNDIAVLGVCGRYPLNSKKTITVTKTKSNQWAFIIDKAWTVRV